ncbi:MAG: tyrosine-type recombinase/integrase [Candidatus Bathyarchaeota archaeon]|nr:MAG: tyrosine-type recombinase/integrase [Candidatus Bathyarchaeota archaeon]
MAQKLQNPRLLRINFHTLRHWKATTLYHKTRDPLFVKEFLGHKKLDTTLIYIQLAMHALHSIKKRGFCGSSPDD